MASEAYPEYVGETTSESAVGEQKPVITSAALTPGHFYVAVVGWESTLGGSAILEFSAGWTIAGQSKVLSGGVYTHMLVAYRVAYGTADSDGLQLNLQEAGCWQTTILYEFTGAYSVSVAFATGTGTNPDPASVAISPSTKNMALAVTARSIYETAGTEPSGYSTIAYHLPDNNWMTTIHGAYKTTDDATLNPGAFSNMNAAPFVVGTIGIYNYGPSVSFDLVLPLSIPSPTISTKDYGIRTWDSSGTLTMDTDHTSLVVLYSHTAPDDESDSVVLSELDGKTPVILEVGLNYVFGVSSSVHDVTVDGTTVSWVPSVTGWPMDTLILVCIYG